MGRVGRTPVTLALSGDVMTGRGVDQILPHPGDPALREGYIRDARDYVALAEAAHGTVPGRPVDFTWPWGAALDVMDAVAPDARVVNLETSVTTSDDFAPGKAVNYRMHPDNVPCLTAARPDVCVLANNHVLDFGRRGLEETLDVLRAAGLTSAGAGRDAAGARRPAAVATRGGGRVLVLSCGTASSGIPARWAAGTDRPGVDFLPDLSRRTADALVRRLRAVRRDGDLTVVSIHWGSNWGYAVPPSQTAFARRLVDGGVDVVHGHSSHHPRPIEVYRGRLVLYGCGDLVDDYEGIRGYERYRDDLRLLYFPSLDARTGELTGLRVAPLLARRLTLRRAPAADADWLCEALTRAGQPFGTCLEPEPGPEGFLRLRPPAADRRVS
ncbi:CapA family protein [Streptomyces chryseus]|uniref:Polyglutamine synthesis accessory protein n=1 Tax=Streptomyces chryseus TaxID=68186 RepID=A0ABQ3DLB0_9ACTN|nr:putative polyglutamine synthesis accessory protein [Streptomyces chryseus]GHB06356.1 putative polyglutamine synthesis accessory protein [Streptomyces chryseus]